LYRVVEVFEITGRGTVAVFEENIDLNGGKPIQVAITRPDGVLFHAMAFSERLLRRVPVVLEQSALLLQEVPKESVPTGSMVTLL